MAGTTEQELTKLFDKLTTSKDALSKFVSSVQFASEAYSNLMNPNVSSADILSSIQSINEAVSSMGGSLNWEFIGSQENSLELLGNAIDHISRKYAESVLSGAGIDVNSKFGQMLANNIIQAQKASEQLSNLNTNVDSLQSAYSDLTDIVEAYNETGYLTFDQLQTLLDLEPQYLQCLIDENGQLQLNEQAMVALANQRLNDAEAQAVQQAITELGQLALQDEKTAVEENAQAFTDAVDDLAGYNQELANTIAEATIGASAIRDLNAAIKGAESEGATDDQINTVLNNLETKLQAINSVRDRLNTGGLGSVMGSKKSSNKDTTETFDWIENAIENIEKAISRLKKISDSAYTSAREKNQALANQIQLINSEIALQQQAYEGYMTKANSIGLSDDYKNLVQNGSINIEDITDKDLQEAIKNYSEWYNKAQDTQDAINDLYEQSNDLHVAAYKLHLEKIDGLRNSQSVSEREYLDRKHALWEKYYANNVKLANQAKEAKLELLEEEKDYLESVASAASSMFDDQIDNLEKQRDSIVLGYKNQIDIIEDKKNVLEEQLNTLEEERKEQELLLNLQKEQYALERAKNQKSVSQYVDGQMIFTTKDSDIREARQAVDNAKFEIAKHNIEKQISAYDDQIEKLNDLIDSTNKYYDNEVNKLTQLQNEWEKALQLEGRVIKRVNFESMFGDGSITKLLNGDLSMVKEWKEAYFGTLKDIDITSQGQMGEITEQYAKLAGIDLSNTTTQTKEVASQFDVLKESVDGVTSAIAGTSGGTTQNTTTGEFTNGEEQSKEGESTSANSLVGAIDASYQAASEKLPAEVEMMNGLTESTTVAMTEVNSLGEAINALPDEKTITINVVTNGSVSGTSISGNAYADGTRHAEKGLAIVGEEKPEVILTNDDKVLLATKPTLLNMEGGETVFDGKETAKLLRSDGLKILEKADSPLLRAFSKYTPDEIMSRFGMNYAIPNYTSALNNANAVMNSNVVNRNVNSSPTVNLNVNCPGVTSTEVANQITTILHREIGGIGLDAMQKASITR